MQPPAGKTALDPKEAARLGAGNSLLFSQYFFPRTCRVRSPEFHNEVWAGLDNPAYRYFAAEIYRDGAKTSLTRVYVAKRIAYALSRTILFVGKGQDHAQRSVEWLRGQVDTNRLFAQTFGLRRGAIWTGTELEVFHGIDSQPIRIIALGITGQVRGVNVDDYRPDLIVVDDPCDEENTATPEQRKKTADLFFGALARSLAPSAESPAAKMVLLQTPLNREDLISTCMADPQWHGVRFGCFDERGESRWPERKPTAELLEDKEAYIRRNQLSIWLREMECKLVSPETTAFDGNWLQYYENKPESGATVMVIDPVPPPTEVEIAKGLRGKDEEAIAVVRRFRGKNYVLEVSSNRGHEPSWTVAEFFRLALKYQPHRVVVETVAYQKTLEWLIRQAMKQRKMYWVVEEFKDRRKKFDRIVDALAGPASAGALLLDPSQTALADQFASYPDVAHDDQLEAVAIAVMKLDEIGDVFDDDLALPGAVLEGEYTVEAQRTFGGCP